MSSLEDCRRALPPQQPRPRLHWPTVSVLIDLVLFWAAVVLVVVWW